MSLRQQRKAVATGTLAAALATLVSGSSLAQTEINWWHAMTGANNDVIVRLAAAFNEAQGEYKVVPTYKGAMPTP